MEKKFEKQSDQLRVMFFEHGMTGGSVKALANILKELSELDCEVGLTSLYKRTSPIDLGSLDCIRFWHCLDLLPHVRPEPEVAVRTLGIPRPTRFGMKYFFFALSALRRFRPDIAYFNNEIESSIPAAIAAKLLGIHTVCHFRMTRELHSIEKVSVKFFDRIIVLTKAAQQIVQANGINNQKLAQIYDPYDLEEFEKSSKKNLDFTQMEAKSIYIVQVGTLSNRKRPDLAIDAFKLAKMECPNLKLVLAGGGQMQDALAKKVESEGLNGSVLLIGQCDKIPSLLKKCHIGLLVSRAEGYPTSVIEYMLGKLPVVTSDFVGITELIDNGKNGFIIPESSPQLIAQALIKLYHSPELRRNMGYNGYHFVNSGLFNLETHIRRINCILENLMQQSRT